MLLEEAGSEQAGSVLSCHSDNIGRRYLRRDFGAEHADFPAVYSAKCRLFSTDS